MYEVANKIKPVRAWIYERRLPPCARALGAFQGLRK